MHLNGDFGEKVAIWQRVGTCLPRAIYIYLIMLIMVYWNSFAVTETELQSLYIYKIIV
jgi:hypothetical protein